VNALWDAAPLIGDRVTVVGAGMVGCCAAALLAKFPGVHVQLADIDAGRAAVANALGAEFVSPAQAAGERDLVVHASATAAGLQRCLELLAPEGTVIELSWYGDTEVSLALGRSFHARRLSIRSSQVGTVSPARGTRHSFASRMALALELLGDPVFDELITGQSPFRQLPEVLKNPPALCHLISYSEE
jgi:threonine dehydrogenase-like Zn-dependent dehydrogenase